GARALVVVSVAVALATATAYLIGAFDPPADPPPATREHAEVVTTGTSPDELPMVPSLRQPQGAVADLSHGDCGIESGQQQVTGTVENTAPRPRDFVITMNWTTDSFDVVGRGVAVLEDVDPGAAVPWEISAFVADGAAQCVPNVQRGVLRD
ncbi:hypothetical protein, partial [Nocardioides sp.]|uniref:hypothetical protein n=1 Tax=Nocardioides sp. TaxID=35761 RepID=UPI002733B1A0